MIQHSPVDLDNPVLTKQKIYFCLEVLALNFSGDYNEMARKMGNNLTGVLGAFVRVSGLTHSPLSLYHSKAEK